MGALLLGVLIAAAFEALWHNVPHLRPHRAHFRAMLALFWSVMLAIFAIDRLGLAPHLFFQGIPRFASDAATYQHQARALAEGLRDGSVAVFVDRQAFNYSRLLAVVYLAFGEGPLVGNVFNAVFYMASLLSIFLIGRQMFGDRVGLVAAWTFGCWPTFLLHETQTLRWATTTAALHLAVLGTLMLAVNRRWWLALPIGVLGFAVLVTDLPYVARLFVLTVAASAAAVAAYPSLGPGRFRAAGWMVALALIASGWYHASWTAPTVEPQITAMAGRRVQTPGARAAGTAGAGGGVSGLTVHPREWRHKSPGFVEPSKAPDRASARPTAALRHAVRARLDAEVAPILFARTGYIAEGRTLRAKGIPVGTAIDGPILFTFNDFVWNLPSAFGVALFEPTVPRLLASKGSSGLGRLSAVEMVALYLMSALALAGLVMAARSDPQTRIQALFIVLLIASAYALLGTTILNGGTLHRLRHPYVGLQCVFAAAAILRFRQARGPRA